MTEPLDQNSTAPKKSRKPKPPMAVRGKLNLSEFRGFLERCVSHSDLFTDAQVRFAQSTLHALGNDHSGLVRVTISPLHSTPKPTSSKYSKREFHSSTEPADDEVRTTTREIALMADDSAVFGRIDSASVEFLYRASSVYGFRAETLVGLKTAFAQVVADIRQMENIAGHRPTDALGAEPGSKMSNSGGESIAEPTPES